MRYLFSSLLLALVYFSPVRLIASETVDAIAVIVMDEIITTYDIERSVAQTGMTKENAKETLIRKKLEAIEIKKRGIEVSDAEIYDEIRRLASSNGMSIGAFYDAVRESNGLSSQQLKEKIKQRLLTQKLYRSIAMSKMKEPSDQEIREYFQLHRSAFEKPSFYDVIVYGAKDRALLRQKIANPMFFSPQIRQEQKRIATDKANPQLLELLAKTPQDRFTPIVQSGANTYITIYVQKIGTPPKVTLEQVRLEIVNALMQEKRAAILDDYFTKLRDSAEIKILR